MLFCSPMLADRLIAGTCLTCCLLGLLPASGSAQPPASGTESTANVPASDDPRDEHQTLTLDRALREAHDDAVFWHYSWVTFFSSALLFQGGAVALAPQGNETRPALAVGFAPPAIGLALQFIRALDALSLESDLELVQALPAEAQAGAKRALLQRYAESEGLQRNWFAHVGPILFNGGMAALLYWGFDNTELALTQLGVGIAVSQIRLWTSPTVAMDAVKTLGTGAARAGLRISPVVGAGYLGVAGVF